MNLIYKFFTAFVVLLLIFQSGFVQVKYGQNSNRIKIVEENDLRLNQDGEGTDSFLLQNYKPILKTRKKKVKKNGQNSFLLKNYKPVLNARKKKVKEVCQKYNLASEPIQNLTNIFCTFQYKVR